MEFGQTWMPSIATERLVSLLAFSYLQVHLDPRGRQLHCSSYRRRLRLAPGYLPVHGELPHHPGEAPVQEASGHTVEPCDSFLRRRDRGHRGATQTRLFVTRTDDKPSMRRGEHRPECMLLGEKGWWPIRGPMEIAALRQDRL